MTEHPWINGQNDVGLSLKCYFYIIYYNVCNFTHNPLDNVSSLAYNKCTSPAFLSLIVNRKHVISLSDFSIFNYLQDILYQYILKMSLRSVFPMPKLPSSKEIKKCHGNIRKPICPLFNITILVYLGFPSYNSNDMNVTIAIWPACQAILKDIEICMCFSFSPNAVIYSG